MADSAQDASASSNSNTTPQELVIVIDYKGWDITEFYGTRAMLESEGILPGGFEWPEGYDRVCWQDDRFHYWLIRRRPEGAKGSRKQFANVDWFQLRWDLLGVDLSARQIARKAKELKDLIYRHSRKGLAESQLRWERFYKAQDDKQFQAFKAKIPCLSTESRNRKATQIKNDSIDEGAANRAQAEEILKSRGNDGENPLH